MASHELRLPNGRSLALDPRRPRVMGVINITPDSFSDGGRFLDTSAAIDHAHQLLEDGADLIDLGAESTRPGGGTYESGAVEVAVDVEWRRLEPVLQRLRQETTAVLSVDTHNPDTARNALLAGADLINDVDGLRRPAMREVLAACGVPAILMHSRGEIGTMQKNIVFDDVVLEVADELRAAANTAKRDGVEQIILDPGIGFGKTYTHNLQLVAALDRLADLGYPLAVGTSRKAYLGALTDRAPADRVAASLASVARAASIASIFRVHDVRATVDFLKVWCAHDNPEAAFSDSGSS